MLLLTATVAPQPAQPGLVQRDPGIRRKEYERALASYLPLLDGPVRGIVLAENSGADLSTIRAVADASPWRHLVEVLPVDPGNHPPAYGRAYGELRLVDQAMERSTLLAPIREAEEPGPTTMVWKVTGRYLIPNLGTILRRRQPDADLCCNLRRWPRPWADLYLLGWSTHGYVDLVRRLADELRLDRPGGPPEERLRALVDAAPSHLVVQPRLLPTPRLDAIRGTDGRPYADPLGRAKHGVRQVASRVTPWLWI